MSDKNLWLMDLTPSELFGLRMFRYDETTVNLPSEVTENWVTERERVFIIQQRVFCKYTTSGSAAFPTDRKEKEHVNDKFFWYGNNKEQSLDCPYIWGCVRYYPRRRHPYRVDVRGYGLRDDVLFYDQYFDSMKKAKQFVEEKITELINNDPMIKRYLELDRRINV